MAEGMIFDIEEFAVHDGPGIRTTVFLKGCPLRCNWCHNPEGISFRKQLMVSTASCIKCGNCSKICNNKDGCIACGNCIEACPLRLRRICGTVIEASELAGQLLKEKEFLIKNHGGITFSGGEPLAQPKFLSEVLDLLQGMHKAIETSGYAPYEIFKSIVDKVDLVMMDIKHTDSETHRRVTGVNNEPILKNLEYLCSSNKKFIIRIPLIPGINDSESNIRGTAKLLMDTQGLERVELLPYHKTAGAKYEMIGKIYSPVFDTEKKPEIHRKIFDEFGIRSIVL
jgi:pyruvate formate lyase activating enzyme